MRPNGTLPIDRHLGEFDIEVVAGNEKDIRDRRYVDEAKDDYFNAVAGQIKNPTRNGRIINVIKSVTKIGAGRFRVQGGAYEEDPLG